MRRYLLFGTELYALPILRPLAAAIASRGGEIRWFLHGIDPRYLSNEEMVLTTVAEVRAWQPAIVLSAANWVPDFFPGIKVQVFHGFNVEKRPHAHGHFRVRGLFDLYCTQGPALTLPFKDLAARLGHFRVSETGWPKLDPLFVMDNEQILSWRKATAGRALIAFGSTFTRKLSAAPELAETIAALVASGRYYWLLTLHPKSDPVWFTRYRAMAGEHAEFVESDRLMDLMRSADVLIADTSSIISEFLVQRKPVVTFNNRVPQTYMINIDQPEKLENAIAHALTKPEALMAAIDKYANSIHPYQDGKSSERVLDACEEFLLQGQAGLQRKPMNLWRRWQMRWWLKYFRF